MKTTTGRALFIATLSAVSLFACERNDTSGSVGEKIDRALDTTQRKLAAAGDAIAQQTDRAVSNIKQKAAEHAPAEGTPAASDRKMSDAAITASIKADLLKDPDLSVLKIEVDTHGGVVALNGLAENEEARQRAEKIAQGIKGVKEVHNHLVVKQA
jgi:hyperosmotically inducible protein